MAGRKKESKQRKEALSVQRLINEMLVQTLGIPSHNIVNDAAFSRYTDSQRPDILISNVAYLNNPGDTRNEEDFISNLICYAEAKDISCKVDDADWKDAIRQGREKAPKLGLSYFAVTNCSITYFYNLDGRRLSLNGSPITEFQTMDVMRIMKRVTGENHAATDIDMSVDSLTAVSEAVFNAKLWQLKNIYRGIDFENNMKKIDFTIGLISMEYYEEKAILDGTYDENLVWWSKARSERSGAQVATDLLGYIGRLVDDASDFKEFSEPVKVVEASIRGVNPLVRPEQLKEVYEVVDSMRPLHGTGFDLFGAVYEAFANSKEKKDFGEYFTRRHYTHIFAKLLLKGRDIYDGAREFNVIDPFCGTGGMLTEAYKVLRSNYKDSNTYDGNARDFLSHRCFYGVDLRSENASRSKLNMFLVGDGHNHIYSDDSLVPVPVKDVLDCMSGNSGLTEELIYSMSLLGGDKYEVLTASTTGDTAMGHIVPCLITKDGKTKQMKVFENKDGLLVIRKGKAGSTRYLPKGKYTINDDAYILSVKSRCPYKIDLRWLALAYRSQFLAYASNSDNGTWNMTGFFDNVTLDIPAESEQKQMVQLVNEAQRYEDLLLAVQQKLGSLLKKEIDLPSMDN